MSKFLNETRLEQVLIRIKAELDKKSLSNHTHSQYLKTTDAEATYAKKSDITKLLRFKGTLDTLPTYDDLNASDSTFKEGDVYNIGVNFNANDLIFLTPEYGDKEYPAGTNVVVVRNGSEDKDPLYLDILGSWFDISNLSVSAMTEDEVTEICNSVFGA